jgi:hypothetical protein
MVMRQGGLGEQGFALAEREFFVEIVNEDSLSQVYNYLSEAEILSGEFAGVEVVDVESGEEYRRTTDLCRINHGDLQVFMQIQIPINLDMRIFVRDTKDSPIRVYLVGHDKTSATNHFMVA